MVVVTARFVKPVAPGQEVKLPQTVTPYLPPAAPEKKGKGKDKSKNTPSDGKKPEIVGPQGYVIAEAVSGIGLLAFRAREARLRRVDRPGGLSHRASAAQRRCGSSLSSSPCCSALPDSPSISACSTPPKAN